MRLQRNLRLTILGALAAATMGVGLYTFSYADGLSYFSKDPQACANCHIMRPQLASWQKASHHGQATCVDCHLPDKGLGKWIAKADNGYRHSKGFTLQDFPEPIQIQDGNSRILQANCLRCHGKLVHELVANDDPDREGLSCVHCHSMVGHGQKMGLGGPESEIDSRELSND